MSNASRSGDFWGGLASMLVALPSSIAFGVLVYSTLGTEYMGAGALAGILGAAAIGIVAPFVGRTGGLISAPCAPAAAVLSSFLAGMMAGNGSINPDSILPLMAFTILLSAGLQILFGVIGGGRLIKFVPYPVVCGYMSGVGVLIALSQLPKLFSLPKNTALSDGLVSPSMWNLNGLAVGIATITVMIITPKITKKVPASILGLSAGMLTYFACSLFSRDLLSLEGNPLLIGPINASGDFFGSVTARMTTLFSVDLASLKIIVIPAVTLAVLLSIDTLKTCVVLDALTRSRHNSDRELIGQGVGNLVSFMAGGIPGAGTMGPTLVNVTSGGRTHRSGIIEGALVIVTLLLLSGAVAWVPVSALAAILLVIAFRMFDWRGMLRLLRTKAGRFDFAVIAGVIIVAVAVDLIAASLVGVTLAIVLFIRDQIHGSVIRRKRGLDQMSSKTRRSETIRNLLKEHGSKAALCELQGNLFFGTTDQLFSQLEEDLRTRRYILFDMRRVQSMDYTAAHLFEQMQAQLEERGGCLLFSGMPSGLHDRRNFNKYLAQLGVVRQTGGIKIFETLDSALEWAENRILEDLNVADDRHEPPLQLMDFDLFREFDSETLERFSECIREVSFKTGERIFSVGDTGDELYLVRKGSVKVLLPLKGETVHHLTTISRGDFFGEVSFLDRSNRSTNVEVKTDTDLYAFSRNCFNTRSHSDPVAGVKIFARIAITLGKRLRHTDAELQALEER